jgi:hypothetical protein
VKTEPLQIRKQVEVFRTTVKDQESAALILVKFQSMYPQYKVNFDLDDCDNIFRVEYYENLNIDELQTVFQQNGFSAFLLEDPQF